MNCLRIVRGLLVTFAFLAPVASGLFRVWLQQDAVQIGYALTTATTERQKLLDEVTQLEVEMAAESSPEHLLRLAEKHGMVAPPPERVFGMERITLADGT